MPHGFLVAGTALALVLTTMPAAVTRSHERGVTRSSVTVGGVLSTDPAAAGADLGARARFARTKRVHGRTIEYLGAVNATDAAGMSRLTEEAFAVVPAVD